MASLSPVENEFASYIIRVEIMGKRGKKVPVLLSKSICEIIEVLLQTGNNCSNKSLKSVCLRKPIFNSEDAMSEQLSYRVCSFM